MSLEKILEAIPHGGHRGQKRVFPSASRFGLRANLLRSPPHRFIIWRFDCSYRYWDRGMKSVERQYVCHAAVRIVGACRFLRARRRKGHALCARVAFLPLG